MMWKKRRVQQAKNNNTKTKSEKIDVDDIFQSFSQSDDFLSTVYTNEQTKNRFTVTFFTTLIDANSLQTNILPYILEKPFQQLTDLRAVLPMEQLEIMTDLSQLEYKLLTGHLVIQLEDDPTSFVCIFTPKEVIRDITIPEIESSVFGPKEAFIESLDHNIHLIRKRLPIKECIVEETIIGTLSKTRVAMMYIDDLADPENVNTVRQRLHDIEFDQISDSSFLTALLGDETNTIFPLLLYTERPDRANAVLTEGKIIILSDGSPSALIIPTTLVEFIISFEDYYVGWIIATFLRIVRLLAVIFSITASAIYVAVVTYHYQLIPRDLLNILVSSRREIPFPPILEAFLLELVIEILREAGARLPTKIGQTIGIVGGIVIGTASVEAGLTSNVLLIIVAMGALASFTTPIYQMGNAIRILRFPFLLFAQLWGLVGIALCASILLAHLLQLTSIGRPYLAPFYPPRMADWKDTIVRMPYKSQAKLPRYTNPQRKYRFNPFNAKQKKDIDE